MDIDELRRLHSLGLNNSEIARRMGFGTTYISKRLKELGLSTHQPRPNGTIEERFWERVPTSDDPDACLLWEGPILAEGYGQFSLPSGRKITAHKQAWLLTHPDEPIPPGMMVLHSCEDRYSIGDITYRRCVRHLYLGTPQDNNDDLARTERNPQMVLTRELRSEIQAKYALGGITQRELALEFGLSRSSIYKALKGRKSAP